VRGRANHAAATTRCYGEPGATIDDKINKSPSIQSIGSAARLEVMRPKPLFSVGLFADAQYADKAGLGFGLTPGGGHWIGYT
jgi:hypothetical protein